MREASDRLLSAAKFRQRLTEANLAYNLDKLDEADRLVAGIPAPEPNLEYAQLYRSLVDYHGANGDWKAAADRGAVLVQVSQPDNWVATPLDYLRYVPVLMETGDTNGYEQFRHSIVDAFCRNHQRVGGGLCDQSEFVDATRRGFARGFAATGDDGVEFLGGHSAIERLAEIAGR